MGATNVSVRLATDMDGGSPYAYAYRPMQLSVEDSFRQDTFYADR